MTTAPQLVRRMYAAYNRRDADSLLALLTDDVDWPDGDARLHGKDALRRYWLKQWTQFHIHDEPSEPFELDDGRLVVRIDQTVRTPDGSPVSTARFVHLFQLRDGLTARMDIEPERRRLVRDDPACPRREAPRATFRSRTLPSAEAGEGAQR